MFSQYHCLHWHTNILQLDGEKRDNSWGVFDEEKWKESRKHLSLSLESTFHHCCLEKERDAQLLHRDLSTALLLQLVHQKGLLGKGQKDEEDKTEEMKTKEGQICTKRDSEAKLGRVVWQLLANLKCNTHGVGERLVQEQEDGQASWRLQSFQPFISCFYFFNRLVGASDLLGQLCTTPVPLSTTLASQTWRG